MKAEPKDFKDVVRELESRGNNKEEPGLHTTNRALEILDRPERDYEVILVGGTNGKGSTVEMISELLQYQGLKIGKFKSPHLVTARERIKADDEMISKQEFMDLYHKINSFNLKLSFFEFITVLAYTYFSDKDVDYAIMEVGLGGRFDATNAAENSTAVITNIGKDHTKFLGDTEDKIAEEIAGIIPEDGLLITNADSKKIEQKSDDVSAKILRPEKLEKRGRKYLFKHKSFEIPLKGDFQSENLQNALKTVEKLEGLPKNLEKAFSNLDNEGRMEKISENPEIILDGAHNAPALEETVKEFPDNFICVFAAVNTKDIGKMTDILEKKASKFYLTDAGVEWAEEPEKVRENISKPCKIFEDPAEAFKSAKKNADSGETIIVTGSLYLIGSLKSNRSLPKVS